MKFIILFYKLVRNDIIVDYFEIKEFKNIKSLPYIYVVISRSSF